MFARLQGLCWSGLCAWLPANRMTACSICSRRPRRHHRRRQPRRVRRTPALAESCCAEARAARLRSIHRTAAAAMWRAPTVKCAAAASARSYAAPARRSATSVENPNASIRTSTRRTAARAGRRAPRASCARWGPAASPAVREARSAARSARTPLSILKIAADADSGASRAPLLLATAPKGPAAFSARLDTVIATAAPWTVARRPSTRSRTVARAARAATSRTRPPLAQARAARSSPAWRASATATRSRTPVVR